MRRIGIGVVGTGVIGRRHLESAAATDYIRTVGVTDLWAQNAQEAASLYGAENIYADAEAMFADPEVEAVVLAVPAVGRTDLALKAIAAGKHILIEKPVAMHAADVQRLIDAKAANASLIAGCCSSRFRNYESADELSRRVASGVLGELRVIRMRGVLSASDAPMNPPPAWRLSKAMNGGGIMMNWGCYDLDYILGITGWKLKPVRVFAQTWTVAPHLAERAAPGSDAEAHAIALIYCEGGETIILERGEFTAASQDETSEIIGSRGSLNFRMTPWEEKQIVYHDTDSRLGLQSSVVWSGKEDGKQLHAGVMRDFATALLNNRAPKTTLEQALLVQKITDALYLSANSKRCEEI